MVHHLGRPCKNPADKKSAQLRIRLSRQERRLLDAAAGKWTSTWARDLLLKAARNGASALLVAVLCVASSVSAEPLRIMPLGDSITAGNDNSNLTPGGYRTTLSGLLSEAGYEFDFVGSLSNNPGPIADNNHEGHGGWTLQQLRQSCGASIVANQPDVVLLLAGTNDVTWSLKVTPDLTAEQIAGRLEDLLNDVYYFLPNAVVLVGTLPMAAASEPEHAARSGEVSALYPAVVESQSLLGRSVHLVDVRGTLSQDDLADSHHPSPGGYAKLGQLWFESLQAVVPPPIYHLDSGPLRLVEGRSVPEPSGIVLAMIAILLAATQSNQRRLMR